MSRLDAQLSAIAHPTRRAILKLALRRELSAGELADAFPVSRPAISQHIRVLMHAGLLRERREAQRRLYRLDAAVARALRREFAGFWTRGLARLKSEIEKQSLGSRKRPKRSRG